MQMQFDVQAAEAVVQVNAAHPGVATFPLPNGFERIHTVSNINYMSATSQWAWISAVLTRGTPNTAAGIAALNESFDSATNTTTLFLNPVSGEDDLGGLFTVDNTVYCYDQSGNMELGTILASNYSLPFPLGWWANATEHDNATVNQVVHDFLSDPEASLPGGVVNFVVHSPICPNGMQPATMLWDPTLAVFDDIDTTTSAASSFAPSFAVAAAVGVVGIWSALF